MSKRIEIQAPTKDELAAVIQLLDEAIAYHKWQQEKAKYIPLEGFKDKLMSGLATAVERGLV